MLNKTSKFDVLKLSHLFSIASILLFTSTAALSQTVETTQTDELSAIFDCRSERDEMKRLACYDEAVSLFRDSQEKGEIVTISKTQIDEVKRDSFGFNIPSLPSLGNLFSKSKTSKPTENDLTSPSVSSADLKPLKEKSQNDEKSDKTPKIETKADTLSGVKGIVVNITSVQNIGYDKIRVFLENGQVWEQVEGRKLRIPKVRNNVPNAAAISKASLGSFLLRINSKGTAVRVKRVR